MFTATRGSLTLPPSLASVPDAFEILHHGMHKSGDLSACSRLVGIKMLRVLLLLLFFFNVLFTHNYINNILGSDPRTPHCPF